MSTQVPIEYYNKRGFKTGGAAFTTMTTTTTAMTTTMTTSSTTGTMTDELFSKQKKNNSKESTKKVRRAFSMPRNPFRWSRKFKTNSTNNNKNSCGNSIINSSDSGGIIDDDDHHGAGDDDDFNKFITVEKMKRLERVECSCLTAEGGASCKGDGGGGQPSVYRKTDDNVDVDNKMNGDKSDGNVKGGCSCSQDHNKSDGVGGGGNDNNQRDVNIILNSDYCGGENYYADKVRNNKNLSEMMRNENDCVENTSNNTNNNKDNHHQNQYQKQQQQQQQKQNQHKSGGDILTSTASRIFRRSSFRKFLSRIAQHVTSVSIGANNKHSPKTTTNATSNSFSDRVPPIGGYQWPPDQTPGVMGLKNHGNTCFMNAVLQCLSHTDILAEYFVLDQYKADLKRRNKINSRKFGTKGELTEQLANVLKALWTCKNESDHSTSFKAVVDRYGSQFRSSTQHDAQEFLFWLLDKVHEDLNTATKRRYKTIKNNYGRPDEVIAAETLANHIRCNNSFVQAVFQAQFRSSLTCPRCKKQSNTFDPFHCISVQLPQLSQQIIFVTVLYVTQHPRQVKLGLSVPSGSPIIALREQLHADTGIAVNRMVLADINETGFSRVFYDSQPISTLEGIDSIYCIEIPEMKAENSSDLMLLIANVKKDESGSINRFGTPFCVQVNRDCSYVELQKKLLKEMSTVLKPEVFAYKTPLTEMFQIRLQDPSADPDTYLEQVEHPLFMEIIDMALSVLSSDAGPQHIKLLLEWANPEEFFSEMSDSIVEHESVSQMKENENDRGTLTLEQCLEHYTKAETLSAEDAWRCPNCQQYLPVVKTLGLWSLPDILVIHFKRFRQQQAKGPEAAKLTTMVKFPLNAFDMSPHLARGSASSNDSLNNDDHSRLIIGSPWRKLRDRDGHRYHKDALKDNRYDLYAVCYHQGDTLETGHYTAACKNPYDHQWYKFDDQRVTHVPADKIPEDIVNNEAYILFYQRRKMDNSECSGTSSTSGDHWVSKIAPPIQNSLQQINTIENETIAIDVVANSSNSSEKTEKNNEDDEKNPKTIEPVFEKVSDKYKKTTKLVIMEKTDENEIVDIENIEKEKVPEEETVIKHVTENKEPSLSKEETTEELEKQDIIPVKSKTNELEIVEAQMNPRKFTITSDHKIQTFNIPSSSVKRQSAPIPPTSSHHDQHHLYNGKGISNYSAINSIKTKSKSPSASEMDLIKREQTDELNIEEVLSSSLKSGSECLHTLNNATLRHSFSTSSGYKLKDCDAISMLRNTAHSCSKDTLIFIDQQTHGLMEDEDSFLGGRSLWISPVTPHKLITVSPKN